MATDDFNRANAATLGANWTACVGAGLGIVSNKAEAASGSTSTGDLYTAGSFAADQYAQAVVSARAAGRYFSVLLRGSGSGGSRNCYQVTAGGTSEYYLTSVASGSGTDFDSGTAAFADGDVIRAEVEGTTIRYLKNTVLIDSSTSSTHSSGDPGLEIYWEGATCQWDNFEAGDIGAGGATIYTRKPLDSALFQSRVIQ